MSYKYKQIKDLKRGRKWERLFCEITGATKGTFNEDVNHHTDVWLDGESVDVKGLKRSHKKGNVLLEFKNVQGRNGWCSPDGADKLAFLFEDGFYVLKNKPLYKKWTQTCYDNSEGVVDRRNGLCSNDMLYQLVGRTGRRDVFTYITKDDLLMTDHCFWAT